MSKIEEQYRTRTARSAERGKAAEAVMPGGDTRAAGYHGPYPLTLDRGEGPFLWDVDDHRYIDLIGNYTSLVHGHAYPPIVEAIRSGVRRGTAWPARCNSQIELAEQLIERVPSVEKVRFTNSGTESAMLAIQIARIVTGRHKILMARHGYHGGYEDVELGFYGQGGPSTYVAEYGQAESFESVLTEHGSEIACVVLEPVMGSAGIVASPPGFLARVREATHRAGALFVLDEVICFRLSTGGAQQLYGVEPDLTLFGKLIGGGLPVGAVGGREECLAVCDPRAPRMFHSGTFNGNPLTTAAGVVSVRELTAERIDLMEQWATELGAELAKAAARVGLPFSINHVGSLLNVFFTATPPAATLARTDNELMAKFHLASLNRGLFFAPRGFIAMSTVLSRELIGEAIERAAGALTDVADEQS